MHRNQHLHSHNLRFQAGDCNVWAPADRDTIPKRDAIRERDADRSGDIDAERNPDRNSDVDAERDPDRDADERATVDGSHNIPPAYQSALKRRHGFQQ